MLGTVALRNVTLNITYMPTLRTEFPGQSVAMGGNACVVL